MNVKLVCQDPLASPREIVIDQFPCDLGRSSEVAIRIDDRWLSRRHCRLEWSGETLVVRDLGSRHGTFVNGRSISECKLLPGDRLCLGLTHFVAEYEVSVPDSAVAALVAPRVPVLA